MKEIKEVKEEINQIIRRNSNCSISGRKKVKEEKIDEKRILFLTKALYYLETKPRQEFIEDQLRQTEKVLLTIPIICPSKLKAKKKEFTEKQIFLKFLLQ